MNYLMNKRGEIDPSINTTEVSDEKCKFLVEKHNIILDWVRTDSFLVCHIK